MKRALFVLAAAMMAAAIANPIVESMSSAGMFGPGFGDHDQSSVVPTFAIAAFFAFGLVAIRTVRALRGRSLGARFVDGMARDLARRARASDVPFVLAVQFVTVYAMERMECFVHALPAESGLAWLGGPAVVAIAAHVLTGIAVTFALGWAVRAVARLLATVVRAVLDAIAFVRARAAASFATRSRSDASAADSLAHVRGTRGRAPPSAPALA